VEEIGKVTYEDSRVLILNLLLAGGHVVHTRTLLELACIRNNELSLHAH
jgi:hypothetical protein